MTGTSIAAPPEPLEPPEPPPAKRSAVIASSVSSNHHAPPSARIVAAASSGGIRVGRATSWLKASVRAPGTAIRRSAAGAASRAARTVTFSEARAKAASR